eukprot:gene14928-14317_t
MESSTVEAAGVIKLEVVEGRGRCVIAARDVAPGEVILRSCAASCTVLGPLRGERCSWCLERGAEEGGGGDDGSGGEELKRCSVTSRTTVDALESHNAEMERSRPQLYEQLQKTAALAAAVGLGQGQADAPALLEHLCRFHCNNFGIVNSLFAPEGAGCYPWGALLNHGCSGNCVLTYAPDPVTG